MEYCPTCETLTHVRCVEAAYRAGLEAAAKVCEDTERFYGAYHAKRIRALAAAEGEG